MFKELSLFPEYDAEIEDNESSTFKDNMKLPIHKWYRYTAGFSATWVAKLINDEKNNHRTHVIDPFTGSGTVLIESAINGVDSFGLESNPYVYKIAKAKLQWDKLSTERIKYVSNMVLEEAKEIQGETNGYPTLIRKCFPDETLKKLDALKTACLEIQEEQEKNFIWFVITSILRSTSPVGTAQWQYIQPNKQKSIVLDPYIAFSKKIMEICSDINMFSRSTSKCKCELLQQDAIYMTDIPDSWGDLVITSPPYANNYDYADAMRLEMMFWGDIKGWNGLENVSSKLVRSCTQHVSKLKTEITTLLESPQLEPIRDDIKEKYCLLEKERENHGGKKNYHYMIVAYFYDMANVFKMLDKATNNNCKMCFVIGDSAPYGIYIPVDDWLGKIAINNGFNNFYFEKLRDRNIKWKNRKHRVPLKEGRLWINK